VYMDNKKAIDLIKDCFELAHIITEASPRKISANSSLWIVATDFYGSYWAPNKKPDHHGSLISKDPKRVLYEALGWLFRL